MSTVEVWRIFLHPIKAVGPRQGVGGVEINAFPFPLSHEVNTISIASFDDEVSIGVELLKAVNIEEVPKVLVVRLNVHGDVLGQIQLYTKDAVHTALHVSGFLVEHSGCIGGRFFRAGKEAVKEVHDIAVALGADEVLRVKPGGHFEPYDVVDVVLHAQARLGREGRNIAVVLNTCSGFHHKFLYVLVVHHVGADVGSVLVLFKLDVAGIKERKLRAVAVYVQAIFQLPVFDKVGEVHADVKATNQTLARTVIGFGEVDFILRIAKVRVEIKVRVFRHGQKVEPNAKGVPAILSRIKASIVAKVEAADGHLAAGLAGEERKLAIDVNERIR